jgi:Flp pilus assembly protein TadD
MPATAASFMAAILISGCVTTETAEKDYDTKVSEVVLAAAVEAERTYNYENAVRHFEILYERDRTDPNVVRDLARNLRYAGSPKQAIAVLKRAMEAIGPTPALTLELAKAQLAASELADARDTLGRAESMAPLADTWQFHLVWGIYHDRSEHFAEAQGAYRQALMRSPDNVAVLNNLALSHALSGEIDKGVAMLQKIVDDETATGLTRQNLALLYGIRGDLDAAGQLAKKDLPRDLAERNLDVYREFRD